MAPVRISSPRHRISYKHSSNLGYHFTQRICPGLQSQHAILCRSDFDLEDGGRRGWWIGRLLGLVCGRYIPTPLRWYYDFAIIRAVVGIRAQMWVGSGGVNHSYGTEISPVWQVKIFAGFRSRCLRRVQALYSSDGGKSVSAISAKQLLLCLCGGWRMPWLCGRQGRSR